MVVYCNYQNESMIRPGRCELSGVGCLHLSDDWEIIKLVMLVELTVPEGLHAGVIHEKGCVEKGGLR